MMRSRAQMGRKLLAGMALSLFLGACASSGPKDVNGTAPDANDPLEDLNRATFAFNDVFQTILLEPLARGYRAVFPEPLRDGISNAVNNLNEPWTFGNDLLQGKPDRAADTLARFMTNSTFGVGGLFDVAEKQYGIPRHSEDFGQTLAVWGVGEGPYLVLPIFGPSNPRDGVGLIAEFFGDPVSLGIDAVTDADWPTLTRAGAGAITAYEANMDVLNEMMATSLDPYATMRSLYRQNRLNEIYDGNPPTPEGPDPFDEFDERYDDYEGPYSDQPGEPETATGTSDLTWADLEMPAVPAAKRQPIAAPKEFNRGGQQVIIRQMSPAELRR